MNKEQAGGYLFEQVAKTILGRSGFVDVRNDVLEGRGANHQIDAFGVLRLPTPFVHPIRLICEAKWYKKQIGLPTIRNFVGVIKDISENYWFRRKEGTERFTDAGCIMSFSAFSKDAQDYAWAQNIFLVSFAGIDQVIQIRNQIDNFLDENKGLWQKKSANKAALSEKFMAFFRDARGDISLYVGMIDGIYPIIIAGRTALSDALREAVRESTFRLRSVKSERVSSDGNTTFKIDINFFREIAPVAFSLPNGLARRLIKIIDKGEAGGQIFYIDVPVVVAINANEVRAIVRIDVLLPDEEKDRYLAGLHLLKAGSVVKSDKNGRMYWIAGHGKRYWFSDEKVFLSWFPSSETRPQVSFVNDEKLSLIPFGGNITYRPGSRIIRLPSDSKMYVVSSRGILRWLSSNALAEAIFGATWRELLVTVPEEMATNYVIGADVCSLQDYDPVAEFNKARLPME